MAEPQSAVEGALRAASRRPPGVARSRLRLDLWEPRTTVLLSVLITQRVYWVDRCNKGNKGRTKNVDEIPYVEVFEEFYPDQ